ncbi:MAG: ABC transporter ATP-binding protein [Deltaproteobacteria bacterium]|nr:ABC transporter ATP-binding protein [Deltaproteobacteria bacterium]
MYLEVKDLTVLYDRAMVLNEVSIQVDVGEMVSLVGPNGAGKTSLLRAMSGLVKWEKDTLRGTTLGKITFKGSVKFDGNEMIKLPAHEIAKRGLILCPERGRPFPEMTVLENLETGAFLCKDKRLVQETLDRVYELFPILKERTKQISGSLSGGERTMLSIGRSLMSQAKLLLIDEPSTGLAPMIKEDLFTRIKEVHGLGITILLVEQDVSFAFDLASRNYVMSRGKIIAEGSASELLGDELIRKTYLGL